MIAIYSLAAHGERPPGRIRHSFWAAVDRADLGVLVAGVLSPHEDDVPWFAVPGDIVTFFLGAWILLGDNLRTRREYLAELEAKAARTDGAAPGRPRPAGPSPRNGRASRGSSTTWWPTP